MIFYLFFSWVANSLVTTTFSFTFPGKYEKRGGFVRDLPRKTRLFRKSPWKSADKGGVTKVVTILYIKINIFYMRIGTWVYTLLVYERASLHIIRKSRLGDWRYIVERSRVQKFLKNIFIKRKFFFIEMNGRENFYDGSRARATLATSLSGLECYFFLLLEK